MDQQFPLDNVALPQPAAAGLLRNFERVASVVLAGIAIYLLATESLEWVPYVAGGLAGVLVLTIFWPYGAILGLMVAAAMPKWEMESSGRHIKPEHLVVAAFCGILLLRIAARAHRWKSLDRLDFLLLGFLALNFFSSAFTSPDRGSTLRWALLQSLAVAPAFLIGQLVRTQERFQRTMSFWLWVGVLEALFGLICFLSYLLWDTKFGMGFFANLNFIPAVRGSQFEPNIFGSYCTCFAAMFLFYFVARQTHKVWYLLGLSICGIALLLSLARQAWATFLIVAPLVLVYTLRRRKVPWRTFISVTATLLLALLVGASLMKDLRERLETLAFSKVMEDPTVIRRAKVVIQSIDDIKQHPIVGSGSNSFQLTGAGTEEEYEGGEAWLGLFFFRILHDTGIIGVILIGWFFCSLGRRAWRVLSRHKPATIAIGALAAATLVMLIAYELTDASTLAFTWIHLGLLMAGIRIAEAEISAEQTQSPALRYA